MWLEAILQKADLAGVIEELCPLHIRIGDDGSILLSEPRDLELAPQIGLRMTATLEIHWPVLGIQVPVAVRSATLHVRPEIVRTPEGDDALAFKLRIDEADISMLPAFVDRGIVDHVNKELEAKDVQLSWGFVQTLSHVFALPDTLLSARALDLRATAGRVQITGEAMALAILFEARVEPRPAGVESPDTRTEPAPLPLPIPHEPWSVRHMLGSFPAGLAALCGAALGMGALAIIRRARAI